MSVIDVSHKFEVYQAGPQVQRGFKLVLRQDGQRLSGTAIQEHQDGKVTGDVGDSRIWLRIQWDDGKIGGYEGFLHRDHRLRGATWELDDRDHQISPPIQWWSADGYKFQLVD